MDGRIGGHARWRTLSHRAQPSADNDWTLVIRADDEWTPYGNSTEVIV